MKLTVDKNTVVNDIVSAVSFMGFNMRYFNKELISKLVHDNKLHSVVDIFDLSPSVLVSYAGKDVAKKIIDNPPQKVVPLPNFIYALGLCNTDKDYQHKLAIKFKTVHSLFKAPQQDIARAVGASLGSIIFTNIPQKRKLVRQLIDLDFSVEPFNKKQFGGMFKGKDIIISGRFVEYYQEDIIKRLIAAGGVRAHTVRETTGFLLIGESDGKTLKERVKAAKELNVPIINQCQLKSLFQIYGIK